MADKVIKMNADKVKVAKKPVMEGRNVWDVMQKIEVGDMPSVSGLIGSDGKPAQIPKGEKFFGLKSLNLRCINEQEAQGLCRDMTPPGSKSDFVIMKVYVVMSKEAWKELDTKYNLKG